MNEPDDMVVALTPVIAALNRLGVAHCVGGSVASSFHGASRSTMDIDLLCELTVNDVEPFAACFDNAYYVYLHEAARSVDVTDLLNRLLDQLGLQDAELE